MKQLFAGLKSGVGPVLKIMKDSADNPLTTPPTDFEKFHFDSETTKIGYVYDIRQINWDTTTFPASSSGYTAYYLPPGASISTAEEVVNTISLAGGSQKTQSHWIVLGRMFDFPYTPIVEFRTYTSSDPARPGPIAKYTRTDSLGTGEEVGYVEGTPGYGGESVASFTFSDGSGSLKSINEHSMPLGTIGTPGSDRILLSVIELPAMNEDIPDYTLTPVSGQRVLHISGAVARLALPGHDTSETDPNAFIFSEARVPAKIIASGEVSISNGGNVTVTTVLPPTGNVYVDYHARRSSDALHHPPYLPGGTSKTTAVRLDYEIVSTGVKLTNLSSSDIVVRYLILGDDDSGQTSGGSKVLFKGNDGVQDYIRIKRPGSSDTAPTMNEILVDSRLPYLPIVDEGYIAASAFTESSDNGILGLNRKTINFVNNGFLPFVKYSVVYSDHYTRPKNRVLRTFNVSSSLDNKPAGNSVNCRISSNKLEFYMSTSNPTDYELNNITAAVIQNHGQKPIGVRWYLFAIPLSL